MEMLGGFSHDNVEQALKSKTRGYYRITSRQGDVIR